VKGVILAGGTGSRLQPMTRIVNKHLLPVGKYPMIHYSITKMAEVGIKDILVVVGQAAAGLFANYLGNGEAWGVRITYAVQPTAGGVAQALSLADGFVHRNEKFVTLLADSLFQDSLATYLQQYLQQDKGAMVLLKKVKNPSAYGVPELHRKQIKSIEEKPSVPKSNYCVTGTYFYDYGVFEVIKRIRPSARGELEITDVNNFYASSNQLNYRMLQGWWVDAGTFESLYEAAFKLLRAEGLNLKSRK